METVCGDGRQAGFGYSPIEDLHAIQRWARDCWQTSEDHGFHEVRTTFPERLMLVVSELSEALEEYRAGHGMGDIYYGDDGKPEGIPVEIADALIRLGDLVITHNIPITSALGIKMQYNKSRPYLHGKKM